MHWVLSDGSEHGVLVKGLSLGHGWLHLHWGLSGGSRLRVLVKGLALGSRRLHLDYILSDEMLGVLGSSAFVIEGALGRPRARPRGSAYHGGCGGRGAGQCTGSGGAC